MAVEKIEKLVDIPFNFTSRKEKKTIYITSDGTEFEKYLVASDYEIKYFFMREFKEYFSEEKNNLIIGTRELSKALWMGDYNEDDIFNDSFWVRIENEQEKEFLKKFCDKFYKLKYMNLYWEEDCPDIEWIYIMVIKDQEVSWISKKQIENNIKVIQNNFPENIKTRKTIVKKKITRAELIDI